MRLKSNGGTMVVTRKATMPGYNKDVWFSTREITNIIVLSNLIEQYRATYESDDKMFVVHRESQGRPNMESRIAFVNTVSETRKVSRRDILRVQSSHGLCTIL
jgi:hypothetical protein